MLRIILPILGVIFCVVWLVVIFVCAYKFEKLRREVLSEMKARGRKCGASCCSGDSGQLGELQDRNDPLVEETPSKD